MILTLISAAIVFGIIKLLEDKEKGVVDGFISLTFVVAPAIMMFFINIGVSAAELPDMLALFGIVLYFLVPFIFCRFVCEYSWKRSSL